MPNAHTDPLAELLPPLSDHEAMVEANRCLYCFDAPCTRVCPTHIDVPKFIKKISTGNLLGSAKTILDSNLLGATCARVCPVQELCEGACVLQSEHRPIAIGRLQRYALDEGGRQGFQSIQLPPNTGKSVAVVGAGPAGLSCAGVLARFGHSVAIYEKRELPGGLSTYGIISLREPIQIALAEVEMIRGLGVDIRTGESPNIDELLKTHDAVFLAVGLGSTPPLGIEGEENILDGLNFIEQSKLEPEATSVGRDVVVIGAGNTAIDCATVAKRLGVKSVTMVYRRTEKEMTAYAHEYEFAKSEGIGFRFLTQPVRVVTAAGSIVGLECVRIALSDPDDSGRARPVPIPGSEFVIPADQVIKAIGQEKLILEGLDMENGYLKVDGEFETSRYNVFAGGDCVRTHGAASTVMAVQDGKLAAQAIHRRLTLEES